MNSFEQPSPFFEVTGVTLPTHLPSCKCGGRIVDVRGFIEHDNLRGTCTACGAMQDVNVPKTVLGDVKAARSTRFHVTHSTRFETFRRDKFCCVHCGRPAPRAGDAYENIRTFILSVVGDEQRLAVARNAHATSCISCGNLLPGILQSIPFEVVRQLSPDQRKELLNTLDGERLTIDHLFPVSVLEDDGVVRGSIESKLVTNDLLVTSCMSCNWGRRDTIESWDEIKSLLENVVLRGRSDNTEVIGHAHQIHFRVRLQMAKLAG